MRNILKNIDFLLPGLISMILLARLIPFQDAYEQYIPFNAIKFWGVVGVFLLYGMKLSPSEMRKDLFNWRLHALVQGSTYILIPLLVLIFYPVFVDTDYERFWQAVFFLSVLPSTVTMSVVFVLKTNGNLGGAIFNSSISGFLGILLTPLWLNLFLKTQDADFDSSVLMIRLVEQIVVPIILGMLLRHFFLNHVLWLIKTLKHFDKIIVMLIVYSSFSNAFNQDMFGLIPGTQLLVLSVLVIALHLTVFEILGFLSRLFALPHRDRMALTFCGSQKSLVHGSVFALLVFESTEMQVFALLPVMIYHAFQLLFASYKTIYWAKSYPIE
jgi:solute carrier family 10 (sodium/bile acid cotransporter), member 7